MHYDLWDTETSNYFGRFDDEREVLGLVRRLVTRYGDHYADDLGLGRVADDGTILPPLSGAALIRRVEDVLSPPESVEVRRPRRGHVGTGRRAVATRSA